MRQSRHLVVVYFKFYPPYCDFKAIDSTVMSRREALKRFVLKKDKDDPMEVDHIIWKPTEEDFVDSECLSDMNSFILSNV